MVVIDSLNIGKSCKIVCFQELSLLREAVFPFLLCSSAREGSISALETLRQAVNDSGDYFHDCEHGYQLPAIEWRLIMYLVASVCVCVCLCVRVLVTI